MRVSSSYGYVVRVYQAQLAGAPIVYGETPELVASMYNPWLRFKNTGVRI